MIIKIQGEFIVLGPFFRQSSNDRTNSTLITIRKSQAKLLNVYRATTHTKANEHTRARLKNVVFTLLSNEHT